MTPAQPSQSAKADELSDETIYYNDLAHHISPQSAKRSSHGLGSEAVRGLNVKAALSRVSGHEHIYLRVLANFMASYSAKTVAELVSLAQAADFSGLRMAAHSLKGVAATIGADELAGMAKELEDAARGGAHDIIQQKLPAIEEQLLIILASVAGILDQHNIPYPKD
ncbi:MAG: Hpt domain-containing protein [Thermodesulfobacteriota bacterium]